MNAICHTLKIVTLGEVMLRLAPPRHQKIIQASSFDVCCGGAEANVAASLAQLGHESFFISKVPDNSLGSAVIGALKKYGVDCRYVRRGKGRLGIYFLEHGASVRPSSVIYDRKDSLITHMTPSEADLNSALKGAALLHVSGITADLSREAGELTLAAVKKAKELGATVSFDLNYRKRLWEDHISEKQALLNKIMKYTDICFGNPRDAALCLGYKTKKADYLNCDFSLCISEKAMREMLETYHLKCLVTGRRKNISASDNVYSGMVCTPDQFITGRKYYVHIVDRVGTGDAFAAGFLHGYLSEMTPKDALNFGIAASAIKHTIPGDFNCISEDEVLSLMNSSSGRIDR